MSWETEQKAITARFVANTTIPAARIAWDYFGAPTYVPPVIAPATPDSAIWARPTVLSVPGSGRPLGISAASPALRQGLIIVQLFAPAGSGEDALLNFVDETIGIFRRATFGMIRCFEADPPQRVINEDEPWHQINVVIPYWAQDPY